MLDTLQRVSDLWADVMWRICWQGGLAIVLASLVTNAVTHWSPHLRCWLWRLVYVKFLLALLLFYPIPVRVLAPHVATNRASQADNVAAPLQHAELIAAHGFHSHPRMLNNELPFVGPSAQIGEVAHVDRADPIPRTQSTTPFLLWIVGVLSSVAWLAVQCRAASRMTTTAIDSCWLHDLADELASRLGLAQTPGLVMSTDVPSPVLIGMFRPSIVLPVSIVSECSREEMRRILGHELAHVRRRDLWWSWLPALTQVLFFFHPLVWFAHRKWRLSREIACDQLAINVTRSTALDYANTLLHVAQLNRRRSKTMPILVGASVFDSKWSLNRRCQVMQDFNKSVMSKRVSTLCLLAIATVVGVIPWQPVARSGAAQAAGDDNNRTSPADPARLIINAGFEERNDKGKPSDWSGGGEGYELATDDEAGHSGKTSARIRSIGDGKFGTYTQGIDATPLRGKRIEYLGYLRTRIDDGWSGLWVRVDGPNNEPLGFDNMEGRPVSGTAEWAPYTCVVDVPESASRVCVGFLLAGKGTVWGDDLAIRILGPAGMGPGTTGPQRVKPPVKQLQMAVRPTNLDFEGDVTDTGRPHFWGGGGAGYALTADTEVKHSGSRSGRIEQSATRGEFGTYTQMVSADQYRGRRIRFNGFLKSHNAERAGLWCRIDGRNNEALGFDNMSDRLIQSTTEWSEYSIVLDVPHEAAHVAYGFMLIGAGTVWGDDLNIEVLGPAGAGPATTGQQRR